MIIPERYRGSLRVHLTQVKTREECYLYYVHISLDARGSRGKEVLRERVFDGVNSEFVKACNEAAIALTRRNMYISDLEEFLNRY